MKSKTIFIYMILLAFSLTACRGDMSGNRESSSTETDIPLLIPNKIQINTPTPGPTPTISPKITYLIELTPLLQYGPVLAFGETDLIRQQYGDFHQKGGYYPKSIFAPAPSSLEYNLNGEFDQFFTTIMLGEGCISPTADGAFFVLEVDGDVAFRSPILYDNSSPQEVSINVNGKNSLRMEVYSTTNIGVNDPNGDCDPSIWGDPYLVTTHPLRTQTTKNAFSPTQTTPEINRELIVDFYVSTNGNDDNTGTKSQPFQSITHARDVIRTINTDMNTDINVYIRGGTYPISETIEFTEADSGTNGFNIIYQAFPGESPIISGGIELSGFKPVPDKPFWQMKVPANTQNFRNLYVNNKRATRAQTEKTVLGVGWWTGEWSERDGIIMDSATPGWWKEQTQQWDGYLNVMDSSTLPVFSRPQDLELHWDLEWIDIRSRVDTIVPLGNGKYVFKMYQPYFGWAQGLRYVGWANWPEPGGNFYNPVWNKPFLVENAIELLDQPGEWYFNEETKEIFYYPLPGEEINISKVEIPQLQLLVSIKGKGIKQEVHNLIFDGITFSTSSWMRTSNLGTANQQGEEILDGEDAGFGSGPQYPAIAAMPSSIQIDNAYSIDLTNNIFQHMGAAGLGLETNVKDVDIIGNIFNDISDSAITMGISALLDHIEKSPDRLVRDVRINNNFINNSGVEYWGSTSIFGDYVQRIEVSHNQIQNAPNSGISFFGGFGKSNRLLPQLGEIYLLNNRIDHVSLKGDTSSARQGTSDAGGIYLGFLRSNSVVEGNYVSNVVHNYGCYYLDFDNENLILRNNVCDNAPLWITGNIDKEVAGESLLVDNNFTNVAGAINIEHPTYYSDTIIYKDDTKKNYLLNTYVVTDSNWPEEALRIIDNAGLEPEYKYLLDYLDH